MAFFARATINSVTANPPLLATIYANNAALFKSLFPATFSWGSGGHNENHARFAFACLFMFEKTPYGADTGLNGDFSLAGLLGAQTLECNTYARAAWLLARAAWPTEFADDGGPTIIDGYGWNGGSLVGNHCQLMGSTPSWNGLGILFDPTIGVFCNWGSGDLLCAHYNYPDNAIADFFSGVSVDRGLGNGGSDISSFHSNVVTALKTGGYYYSYSLYFARGYSRFNNLAISSSTPTPGAQLFGTYP